MDVVTREDLIANLCFLLAFLTDEQVQDLHLKILLIAGEEMYKKVENYRLSFKELSGDYENIQT